jgi:hypothetical protein
MVVSKMMKIVAAPALAASLAFALTGCSKAAADDKSVSRIEAAVSRVESSSQRAEAAANRAEQAAQRAEMAAQTAEAVFTKTVRK